MAKSDLLTVSQLWGLGKKQAELDFVDVPVNTDIPLFIDPFAISRQSNIWSREVHATILVFFENIIRAIRDGNLPQARELLDSFKEPNETHLGFSRSAPRGAGIGRGQAQELFLAVSKSSAVKTGLLASLAEAELMIEGIGSDKISDLTTNIIKSHLIRYTQSQCLLHGIELISCPINQYFDPDEVSWCHDYFDLPRVMNKALILVPKAIVRHKLSYDAHDYYTHHVLNYEKDYLEREFLSAETKEPMISLVKTLKNGRVKVTKTDIREYHKKHDGNLKDFLFEFSRRHPSVLQKYRNQLADKEDNRTDYFLDMDENVDNGYPQILQNKLREIKTGRNNASEYHSTILGILEYIFYPIFINPIKEREIHEGRKRIDITMDNNATSGVMYRLATLMGLPCTYIYIECKNYSEDINNPEIDQLSGRFSDRHGKFGILCCRKIDNTAVLIQRCRDTYNDGRGIIVYLDDNRIKELLIAIKIKGRKEIDKILDKYIKDVTLS